MTNTAKRVREHSATRLTDRIKSALATMLAGATGLEPAASCVTGRRSNQLNYAPAFHSFLTLPIRALQCPAVPENAEELP